MQDLQNSFIETALVSHNKYRSLHDAPPLKLNPELSELAFNWAQNLAKNNKFEHSKNKYNDCVLGENLYMSWGSEKHEKIDGAIATKDWYDEMKIYDFNNPRFLITTSHFSQLAWKSSSEVGFGVALGDNNSIFCVANYFPPGNIEGTFAENVFPINGSRKSSFIETRPMDVIDENEENTDLQAYLIETALMAHNKYRELHGVSPLKHNLEISKIALKWAQTLTEKDHYEHSNNQYKNEELGENLFMLIGSDRVENIDGAKITKCWYDEVNQYDWNKSEVENYENDTAHFSQVIWKGTREMGIGAAIGANNLIIVCANYYPSGNEVDKYFINVLKPPGNEVNTTKDNKNDVTDSILKTSSQILSDPNIKNESNNIKNNMQTQYHDKRSDSSLSNSNNKLLTSYYFESTSVIYNDEPIQNNVPERSTNPVPNIESSCCIIL